MREQLFRTRITDLLDIDHPILCGGLMWLGDANYAAAAVNAGGYGFMTAKTFKEPEAWRDELHKAKDLTGGRQVGVNLYISMRPEENEVLLGHLDIALEEGARIFETAGMPPAPFVKQIKEAGGIILHKVPAVKYAVSTVKKIPEVDGIIVVGQECGGHPGLQMVGSIVQGVVAAKEIEVPVILGGGFGHGSQLVAALGFGAEAVIMGTRPLVAEEVWSHRAIKEQVIGADETSSTLVLKTFRNTTRVMANATADAVQKLEDNGVSEFDEYWPHVKGVNQKEAYETGDWSKGILSMGQSAVFADKIVPMEEIYDQILDEASAATQRLDLLQSARVAAE